MSNSVRLFYAYEAKEKGALYIYIFIFCLVLYIS